MAEKDSTAQKTPKGLQIPVPTRGAFLKNLRKPISREKPKPKVDDSAADRAEK